MGLIKAAAGAIGSTLKDQWKEAIRCEDMDTDVLMRKVTTENGVISNKSTIIVAPGQCAVIYDNGRIIDATAEDGVYTFDTSSTPSFFAGQFGAVFKEMWQRFTYNGATAKQQAVFFFNIKEIMGNKFGTPQPVDYSDWSHPIPNQMTGELLPMRVEVTCFGNYTFKIANPALFMSEVAGTADVYRKDVLVEQMRSEVVEAFTNLLNELGEENKVPVLSLRSKTDEIKQLMAERVVDEPIRRRGIQLVNFVVMSVKLDEDSQNKVDKYELSSNSFMQQGALVDAYSSAVKDAANNANGAANGFMGIGMMNMASNGMMGGAAQGPWNSNDANTSREIVQNARAKEEAGKTAATEQTNTETSDDSWICSTCNTSRIGNFCPECGAKKPEEPQKLFCSNCGKEVSKDTKFCPNCGNKLN